MASNITSAGSASGMDFESIIAASLNLKKQQLAKKTTYKKETTNIELSGVGKLKSALKTFQDAIKGLSDEKGFNVRKVTTDLPTKEGETPAFTVSTKEDAANGAYTIGVDQVASSERISQTFKDGADGKVNFAAGTYTFSLAQYGEDDEIEFKEFTVTLDKDATIDEFRRKINDQLGDQGVSASVVHGKEGAQLSFDFGITGEDSRFNENGSLSIKFAAGAGASEEAKANSEKLNYNAKEASHGGWSVTEAKNAIITVDGQTIESNSNTFDDQVSGLKITVNKTTKDDDGQTKTYDVKVEQDIDGLTKKVENFIAAYNSLRDTMNSLGKKNTYTDGQNNYDGGELSGDSQLNSLERQLQSIMTGLGGIDIGGGQVVDLYSMGLEVDKEGKFKLDATKFKEGAEDNFNALVKLFTANPDKDKEDGAAGAEKSGEGYVGLITQLNNVVDTFTKSNGILDEREKYLKDIIRDIENQEADDAHYLEQYEENLRKKYAILDTTIAGYQQSMFYLQSVLG